MKVTTNGVPAVYAVQKIGKNIRKKKKAYTVWATFTFALAALSFLSAMVMMIVRMSSEDLEMPIIYTFIPFIAFAVCIVCIPLSLTLKQKYTVQVALLDRVQSSEKAVIASFSASPSQAAVSSVQSAVEGMIDAGLLPDHEIVAGKVVARKDAQVSEDEAERMYEDYLAATMPATLAVNLMREERADKMPKFCPNCGAPVTNTSAKFCESCGVRLTGE